MYLLREEEANIFPLLKMKEAIALIGPRRAGKTTLAKRLLEDWIGTGGFGAYFDLEALTAPSSAVELANQIKKIPKGGLIVLDEVQSIDGWVKVVRNEIENETHSVVVTGSSASLLSKEIASALAGRAIPETILTLSFRDAKNWGLDSLEKYINIGGYPECILRPEDAARLHKLYLELTVLRDVAARKGIRELKPLSDLAIIMLSEPGKTISAKKTAEKLGISQPTFRSFVQGLIDAFLIISVPPYIRSPRERLVADSKYYAYDVGLQSSVSISTEKDYGRKLENVVAVELIRRGYMLSYIRSDSGECDFIAQKISSENLAVQVWSGNGEIPEREWGGLEIGIKTAKAKGIFLTERKLSEKQIKSGILVKTIEEWLMEK